MNYTVEQINHIIYNNRTYENTVSNFIPKLDFKDVTLLLEIGKQLKFVNKIISNGSSVIIDKTKLDLDTDKNDLILFPKDIENFKISSRLFNEEELNLLNKKGITNDIVEQYDISPLSQIKDINMLEKLGVTTHPILGRLLGDGLSSGLIIPLYKDGKFINSTFRKTNELTRLKYGTTVSSIDFWGDEIIKGEEIWLCEGLFDMMALRKEGKRCISSSSCNLSDYLYFKIIKNKPSIVNIFSDNDSAGYRSSLRSKKLFGMNGIGCKVYSSNSSKDAAEHFFELKLDWNSVDEINVNQDMIGNKNNILDFLKYLEERKF